MTNDGDAMTTFRPTNLDHAPDTPDDEVSEFRLSGRLAARRQAAGVDERPDNELPLPDRGQPGRTEWWLGWYDERLMRFYQ
jgi:hypothetical protein